MRTIGLYVPLLLIATHLATGILGGPSKEEVLSAIKDAKEVNFIKRGIDSLLKRAPPKDAKRSGCPAMLSRYLGTKRSFNKKQAQQTEDVLEATRLLMKRGFSLDDLKTAEVRDVWQREFQCNVVPTCPASPTSIRTADGSCNNLNQPTMGMAGAPQKRGLNAVAYGDNLNSPRTKSLGGDGSADLPSPRLISRRIHNEGGNRAFSTDLSLHVMISQFLDHDIAKTPEAEEIADCCSSTSDNCFNIDIRPNDNIDTTGSTCMPFTRSKAVNCDSGIPRIQPNDITSWIDCSNIYGSRLAEQQQLRTNSGQGADLRVTMMNDEVYGTYDRLPDNADDTQCTLTVTGQKCPLAGDDRVAVIPGLTSYHTMGVREHNRIVTALRSHYADTTEGNEALFQRARQIVIAEFQHIYYDEFLRAIVSDEAWTKYKLSSDEAFVYNSTIDGSMSVEFLTAAFRFHTWAPSRMIIFDERLRGIGNASPEQQAQLNKATEETFENPEMTYYSIQPTSNNPRRPRPAVQGLDGLAFWFSGDPSPETDGLVVGAYQNRLFQELDANGNFVKALDLAALNIQRGRDHGLPGYNKFREHCGLSFSSTSLPDHTPELQDAISLVYNGVFDDVDLWTGAFTETKVAGSALGPLLNCLLGEQFQATKFGDRHWYQNAEEHSGFKDFQIAEIRKMTLSKMLCNNMHYTQAMPNAFNQLVQDQLVDCSTLPDMDLSLFAPGATAPPPPPPARDLSRILEELKEVRALESLLEKLEEDKK